MVADDETRRWHLARPITEDRPLRRIELLRVVGLVLLSKPLANPQDSILLITVAHFERVPDTVLDSLREGEASTLVKLSASMNRINIMLVYWAETPTAGQWQNCSTQGFNV